MCERHLVKSDFCCKINAYINLQFALKRVKWLPSMEKLSSFALGQHSTTMGLARNLKVQVQHVQEEKMTILVLVNARLLELNADTVLTSYHTQSFDCAKAKETGQICSMDLQQSIVSHQPGQKNC